MFYNKAWFWLAVVPMLLGALFVAFGNTTGAQWLFTISLIDGLGFGFYTAVEATKTV